RHAIQSRTIRRVLVMVGQTDLMTPAGSMPVRDEVSTGSPSGLAALKQRAGDVLLATLSLDAFWASAATVATQRRSNVVDLSPAGATSEGGFRALAEAEGYHALFSQKDAGLEKGFAQLAAAVHARPHAGFNNIDTLRQIILTCRQNGIALDLALVPRHADYLEALDQAGLWPRYEQVIGALTRLVAADGDDAVRLWDFSGYDTYATEPVPAPTDRSGAT